MAKIEFITTWQAVGDNPSQLNNTSAFLTLLAGDAVLTRNENLWSKTLRDSVLVSTYPLAEWLAFSWWRLNGEPLPKQSGKLDPEWRLAHEIGSANHGYVWPNVTFASDNEVMQVWSRASQAGDGQSVRYLSECALSLPLAEFERGAEGFIQAVLERLASTGENGSDLEKLWELIREERRDPEALRYRKIEAALGYDPDECPQDLMEQALALDNEMGKGAFIELAPLFGRFGSESSLCMLKDLRDLPGLLAEPCVPEVFVANSRTSWQPPWARAVAAARSLRSKLKMGQDQVDDETLCRLLGLQSSNIDPVAGTPTRKLGGVGVPVSDKGIKFFPRKRHPISRRFELSRFIADIVLTSGSRQWLASTDLATSRQKYQRAFAAEFLCPIDGLGDFMKGDYSETMVEEAALHYGVSEQTVTASLANNGLIETSGSNRIGFAPDAVRDQFVPA